MCTEDFGPKCSVNGNFQSRNNYWPWNSTSENNQSQWNRHDNLSKPWLCCRFSFIPSWPLEYTHLNTVLPFDFWSLFASFVGTSPRPKWKTWIAKHGQDSKLSVIVSETSKSGLTDTAVLCHRIRSSSEFIKLVHQHQHCSSEVPD